jgi:hypothetical protein
MKHNYFTLARRMLLLFGLFSFCWQSVQAQVKIGTSTDNLNQGATLEVESGPYPGNIYRGFLPPKVALPNYVTWALAGDPTDGMIIFNTATTTGEYTVTPGVYCWYNFQWNRQSPAIVFNPVRISAIDCQADVAPAGSYYNTVSAVNNPRYKVVTVVPASAGNYTFRTDEQDGFSFSTINGAFTTDQVGKPQSVTLIGTSNAPYYGGTYTFTLTANNRTCNFPVTVVNYLDCSIPATGTYKKGVALDASNTKPMIFTPPIAGNYTLRATVQYNISPFPTLYTFTKDVTFTADQVGKPQNIVLPGTGTSTVSGRFSGGIGVISGPPGIENYSGVGCQFFVIIDP